MCKCVSIVIHKIENVNSFLIFYSINQKICIVYKVPCAICTKCRVCASACAACTLVSAPCPRFDSFPIYFETIRHLSTSYGHFRPPPCSAISPSPGAEKVFSHRAFSPSAKSRLFRSAVLQFERRRATIIYYQTSKEVPPCGGFSSRFSAACC